LLRLRVAAALLTLATPLAGGACDVSPGEPLQFQTVSAPRIWPVASLYDGQTAVSLDALRLRGLHWTIVDHVAPGRVLDDPGWVALVRAADLAPHPFTAAVSERRAGSLDLLPVGGLDPDTDYLLAFPFCSFMPHVDCPPPLRLSTASAPRVLSLWRAGDTLLVVFSEPMNPETLYLGHGAVDMVFEEEGQARSVVADLNIADFAWATEGPVFMVAPISELPFRLILGPEVRAATGEALRVAGDGHAAPGGTFVHAVTPTLLPVCHTRNDYPDPCIDEARAATVIETFQTPFDLDLGL
jgi:hypothetical protein